MKRFASAGAILLIVLGAAMGLFGCAGGGQTNRSLTLGYTVEHYFENLDDDGYALDAALTAAKSAESGATVTEEPVVKDGFVYDAAHDGTVNGIVLQTEGTVLKLYYRRAALTLSYDKNSPTAVGAIAPTGGRYGASVVVAENAFTDPAQLFLGWNTERHGLGTAYLPGDRLTLTATTVLYAQWRETYRCVDPAVSDRIYLTGESGLGSAVLLRGTEEKKGFYDAAAGEAQFMYDAGDLFARLDPETMTFLYRDETVRGIYEYFDYTRNQTLPAVVMNFDGYGFATYSLPDGSGMLASYGGNYQKTEGGDYLYTITMGPDPAAVGSTIYVRPERYDAPREGIVGRFSQQGYEYGVRFYYGNNALGNDQLQLDGYGSALYLTDYDPAAGTFGREIAGRYLATDDSGDWHGEYEFTSADGAASFRFIVLDFSVENRDVYVYMIRNDRQIGTYAATNAAGVTMELDGYDGATYTDGDVTFRGTVTDDGYGNLTLALVDAGGAAAGRMTVRVDYEAKTFAVYTDGLVYEDAAQTIVSAYTAPETAVVIPEGVVKVNAGVFKDTALTSLSLPATLTEIGEYAFQNDHTLLSVRIAASVPPALGAGAFRWPNGGMQIASPTAVSRLTGRPQAGPITPITLPARPSYETGRNLKSKTACWSAIPVRSKIRPISISSFPPA